MQPQRRFNYLALFVVCRPNISVRSELKSLYSSIERNILKLVIRYAEPRSWISLCLKDSALIDWLTWTLLTTWYLYRYKLHWWFHGQVLQTHIILKDILVSGAFNCSCLSVFIFVKFGWGYRCKQHCWTRFDEHRYSKLNRMSPDHRNNICYFYCLGEWCPQLLRTLRCPVRHVLVRSLDGYNRCTTHCRPRPGDHQNGKLNVKWVLVNCPQLLHTLRCPGLLVLVIHPHHSFSGRFCP